MAKNHGYHEDDITHTHKRVQFSESIIGPTKEHAHITGDISISIADSGSTFTFDFVPADYVITIPAPQAGLRYRFVSTGSGANTVTFRSTTLATTGIVFAAGLKGSLLSRGSIEYSGGRAGDFIEYTGSDSAQWTIDGIVEGTASASAV